MSHIISSRICTKCGKNIDIEFQKYDPEISSDVLCHTCFMEWKKNTAGLMEKYLATEELVRMLKAIRRYCDGVKCDDRMETVMVEAVGDIVSAAASMLIAVKQRRYINEG